VKIRAVLDLSLIDYPGKIAAVVFVPGCDFGCPACHARPILDETSLVDEEAFLKRLAGLKQWVSGVVVCGGEPTGQEGLLPFLRRLRLERLSVKLDTNGGAPDVLNRLLGEGLVDYAAMDVKAPRSLFPEVSGAPASAMRAVEESIRVVARFPDHEFRTTVVPVLRGEGGISFLTPSEIRDTAKMIAELTGSGGHKYYLQKFVPRKGGLIDPRLESFPETPRDLLESMRREAAEFMPKCAIRG
jgi:pyruvate formate lyase activating enzyme